VRKLARGKGCVSADHQKGRQSPQARERRIPIRRPLGRGVTVT
jgi:hypothetical protein